LDLSQTDSTCVRPLPTSRPISFARNYVLSYSRRMDDLVDRVAALEDLVGALASKVAALEARTTAREASEDQAPSSAPRATTQTPETTEPDRKSTRLNSSHVKISYAVFCLKKKTHTERP